jgi:hypothetical protein
MGTTYSILITNKRCQEFSETLTNCGDAINQNSKYSETSKSTIEPKEYTNIEECWENDNWINIGGCSKVRGDIISSLAVLEEAKNKMNLVQGPRQPAYPKKYTSAKYGFILSYPETWNFEEGISDDKDIITFYGPKKDGEAVEIIIGTEMAYSTSGALCSNQGCDYNGGTITLQNGTKITLTKSYLFVPIASEEMIPLDTKVENYRFSSGLQNFLSEYPNQYFYITASFPDAESGNQILDVLTTLRYKE